LYFSDSIKSSSLLIDRSSPRHDNLYLAGQGNSRGDRLIDIGCGYGDWINYAREKGIGVVGINISPEQTNFAKCEYDLDVICFDAWMNCYGKDNYKLTYDPANRRKTSLVTLWSIVLKHNRHASNEIL